MNNATRRIVRAAVVAVGLAIAGGLGCGGPAPMTPEEAGSIPVFNPSPDNPLKDVTLNNEYQYLDKIRAGNGKPGKGAKR
ncbi:hypothetical protein [Paludisphaera rhizosphaerae]|uniref:hypothetical protein n=1 Tax=Paludisphaera rhizosphaerae TaxID=2711216 RepID=UPI0013EB8260|nr:hypothetical protein [Paludisphaera rhizosphaerae]